MNEELYKSVITKLKILSMRAQYNDEETQEKRYKSAYKKLEQIQENRYLTEIGEKGKHKEVYLAILTMIEKRYEEKGEIEEVLDEIMDDIEQLCEQFDIKDNNDTEEKKSETKEVER